MRGFDGLGGILARARLRQRRSLVGLLESVGGRNASRLLQWHGTNLAALLAAFGTSQALCHRMQRGVPPAQMGQQIGVGLPLVSAGGTLQIRYCPNSSESRVTLKSRAIRDTVYNTRSQKPAFF